MKALIVGCGYVGLGLGVELLRRGHQVLGVRRGKRGCEQLAQAGISPVTADVTDPGTFTSLPADCDWVVNCCSAGGGGEEEYRQVYLEGNRNLLAWLEGKPLQKYLYTSSTGVYTEDNGGVVDECNPALASAGTGQVLVESERLLRTAALRTGFPAVILRVAGIYGHGRGYWLRQYLAGTAVIEGNGGRRLNMIHRDDVASAIIAALERGKPGEIYNVVDDAPPTQLEVFEWLARRLGGTLPTHALEDPAAPRRRTATNKIVSNHRLRIELGWQPRYPTFRDGYASELRALEK